MNRAVLLKVGKKFSSLLLFLCLSFNVFAQTEADAIVFGFCSDFFHSCNEPPLGNTIVYFNENGIDSITPRILNMQTRSAATYRDENVFYMNNGWVVINGRGEVIVEKLLSPEFQAYNTYNYRICPSFNTGLMLSVKTDSTKRIFLFYAEPSNGVLPLVDSYAAYAELNPYNMDSSEALISTGNILLKDADSTHAGNFSACRHANGRDWWVLKPSWISNKFYKGILGPDGIVMQPSFTDVEPIENNNTTLRSGFSLNGDKYFTFRLWSNQILTIYDFDRCTGTLYNPVIYNLDAIFPDEALTIMCFSPDASKMYFTKYGMMAPPIGDPLLRTGLYQLDFASDSVYLIGDGYSPFGGMMVTPNGKWIAASGATLDTTTTPVSRFYLDIIYQPNHLGLNCNFQPHQYEMLNALYFETPQNWGNYRLGPIDESICDSLGLDAPIDTGLETLLKEQVKVYPNPTQGVCTALFPNIATRYIRVFDMYGKQVFFTTSYTQETTIDFKAINAASGIYFLEINNLSTNQRTTFKMMYDEE